MFKKTKNVWTNIKFVQNQKGVTLVALVVTIFFSYDEYKKYSNNNSFLLATI